MIVMANLEEVVVVHQDKIIVKRNVYV